ncbi:MAG: FecR domain-containing protein [Acidobacteria bacterium]|nr:FecR domain-containing protein [Acidobacteriota bacterium]
MTDKHQDSNPLDRAAAEIRGQHLDEDTTRSITEKVGRRLGFAGGLSRPLITCADYQAEIPAYVAGELPPPRALLVGDHTRECVPCRRVLMEERGVAAPVAPAISSHAKPRFIRAALRAAAIALVLLGGFVAWRMIGNITANRELRASVESIDGSLQIVDRNSIQTLAVASEIRAGQVLRSGKSSGAVLRLDDGSLVEMAERSELELGASRRGTTIDLARGNIIVTAADQGSGRLYVATNDCEVAVKGTIFAVNHGLKGSRVSVIEGEVEVREGSVSAFLSPGDQITTGDRLRPVPVESEIAWSRDAEKHRALLHELTELRKAIVDAVDNAPPRTSTFLLDLAPGDTFVYVAMPNITTDLDEVRAAFYDRLASSAALAQWWQEEVVANGIDAEIDDLLDRLQPLGEAMGDEAVLTVPLSAIHEQGMPLFMAGLDDPTAFRAELGAVIEIANSESPDQPAAVIVDDPRTATASGEDLFLWVEGDVFAAAGDLESLRVLARRVDDPSQRTFPGSALHTQLAQAYAGGISWLLGADLAAAISENLKDASEEDAATLDRLGLLDASTVLIERHRDGDWYATNADIRFTKPRHGMAAWLAEPAPMGSLDFVSPDAYLVAAAVTVDASRMFDDLLELAASEDPATIDELRRCEEEIGFDLRADLAATFGGEAAFAIDGPMLPVPSWKLIVEVYDPGTLMHTVEQVIARVNQELAAQSEALLVIESSVESGRNYVSVRREGFDRVAVMTVVDGFLVVAPSRALIEQAIAYRNSNLTLASSATFKALLPDNGFTDCSALVYRDLGSLIDAVPPEILGDLELAASLDDGLSQGLVCVFGEPERITASATGGSLVGVASTLGMLGASLEQSSPVQQVDTGDPVSSSG